MRLGEALSPLAFQQYFHDLDLRRRIILSQLPLSASVVIVMILGALFHREIFSQHEFVIGLLLHGIILIICTEVPWDKIPYPSFLSIPMLDFIAVAFVREGAGESLNGLAFLVVLPVIWLAASGLFPRVGLVLSFLGPLSVLWAPLFLNGNVPSAHDLSSVMLMPFIMLAVGITVRTVTSSMKAQHRALEAKDKDLRAALSSSNNRERLLDTIVETVGVGVIAVDRDGNDILMNRQQRRHHALALPDGQIDPSEAELLVYGPDKVTAMPTHERPVRRAVGGESFSDYLIWIGEGTGQRVLSTSARAVNDESGRFDGSVVAFSDVTEMVAAMAAQDDFVSNVSHEFRTPLTSMLGYLELVEESTDSLPPTVVRYLSVVKRNADRLLKLVSDLLATTSNSMSIEVEPVDLTELIASAMSSAAVRAAESGVELVNDAPPQLLLSADPARICQVLDNLLSNAIKYSPGGGTVTVRAWRSGQAVLMQVQDTGIGMNETDRGAAFAKFFRSDAVRNTSIPGVGLGLLITKTIIDQHQGTIALESTPGQGTTFTVTLPSQL